MTDARTLRTKVVVEGTGRGVAEFLKMAKAAQALGDSLEDAGKDGAAGLGQILGEAAKVADGVKKAFADVNPEIQKSLEADLDSNLAEQKAIATAKALRAIRKRELADELAGIDVKIAAQKKADRLTPRTAIDPKLTQKVQGLNSSKRLFEDNESIALAADLEAKADAEKKIRALDAADALAAIRQKQIAEELASTLKAIKTEQERQAQAIANRPKASREKLELLESELATLESQRDAYRITLTENLKALSQEKRAQDDIAAAAATEITRINGKIDAAKKYIALQKEEIKKQSGPTVDEVAKIAELQNKKRELEEKQSAENTKAIQLTASRNRIIALAAESKAAADIRKKEYAAKLSVLGEQLKAETQRLQEQEANRPPADRTELNNLIARSEELQRQSDYLQDLEAKEIQRNRAAQDAIVADKKAADTLKENVDQQLADADLIIEKEKQLNRERAVADPVLDTAVRDSAQSNVNAKKTEINQQAIDEAARLESQANAAIQLQDEKNNAITERKKTETDIAEAKKRIKAEVDALAEIEANKPPPDRTDLDAAIKAKADQEEVQRERAKSEETARLARVEKTREANDRREKAQADQAALDDGLKRNAEAIAKENASITEIESAPPVLDTSELDRFTADKSRILAEQEADKLAATKAKLADEQRKQRQQSERLDLVAQQAAADERISQINQQLQQEQDIYDEAQRNKPAPDRSAIEASQAEYQAALQRQELERQAAAEAAKNEADRVEASKQRLQAIQDEQAALRESLTVNEADIKGEKQSITAIETAAPVLDTTELDRLNAEKAKVLAEQKAADQAAIRARADAQKKQQQQQSNRAELTAQKEASDALLSDLEARLQRQKDLYDQVQQNKPEPDRSAIDALDSEYQAALQRQEAERQATSETAAADAQRIDGINDRIASIEQEKEAIRGLAAAKQAEIANEVASIADIESATPVLDATEIDRLNSEKAIAIAKMEADEKAAIQLKADNDRERLAEQQAQNELDQQKQITAQTIAEIQERLRKEQSLVDEAKQQKAPVDRSALDEAERQRNELIAAQKAARDAAKNSRAQIEQKLETTVANRETTRSRRPEVNSQLDELAASIEKEQALIAQIESAEPTLDRSELLRLEQEKESKLREQTASEELRAIQRLEDEKLAIEAKAEKERLALIVANTDAELAANKAKIDAEKKRIAEAEKQTPTADRSKLEQAEKAQQAALTRQADDRRKAELEQSDRDQQVQQTIADKATRAAQKAAAERQAADLQVEIDREQTNFNQAVSDLPALDRSSVAEKEREKEAIQVRQDAERLAEFNLLADNEAKQRNEELIQEKAKARAKEAKAERDDVNKLIAAEKTRLTKAKKAGEDTDDSALKALEQKKADLDAEVKAKIQEPFDSKDRALQLRKEAITLNSKAKDAERAREKELKGIDKEIAARQKLIDTAEAKRPKPSSDVVDNLKLRQNALIESARLLDAENKQADEKVDQINRTSKAATDAIKRQATADDKENKRLADAVKAEQSDVKAQEKAPVSVDKTALRELESTQSDLQARKQQEQLDETAAANVASQIKATSALKDAEAIDNKKRLDREIADLDRALAAQEELLKQSALNQKVIADRSELDRLNARKRELETERESLKTTEADQSKEVDRLSGQLKAADTTAKGQDKTDEKDLKRADGLVAKRRTEIEKAQGAPVEVDTSRVDAVQGELTNALAEKAANDAKQKTIDSAEATRKAAESASKSELALKRTQYKADIALLADKIAKEEQLLAQSAIDQKTTADRSRLLELQAQQKALDDSLALLDKEESALSSQAAVDPKKVKQIESESAAREKANKDELEALQKRRKALEGQYQSERERPASFDTTEQKNLETQLNAARKRATEIDSKSSNLSIDEQATAQSEADRSQAAESIKQQQIQTLAELESLIDQQNVILAQSVEDQKQIADRGRLEELEAQRKAAQDRLALLDSQAADLSGDIKAAPARDRQTEVDRKAKEKVNQSGLAGINATTAALERQYAVEAAKPVAVDETRKNQLLGDLEGAQGDKAAIAERVASLDEIAAVESKAEATRRAELAAKKAQQDKELKDLEGFIAEQKALLIKSAEDQKVIADRTLLDQLESDRLALLADRQRLDEEIESANKLAKAQQDQEKEAKAESGRQDKRDKDTNKQLADRVASEQSKFNVEAAKPAEVDRTRLNQLQQDLGGLESKQQADKLAEADLDNRIKLAAKEDAAAKVAANNKKAQLDKELKDLEGFLRQQQALLDKATAEQRAPIFDEINKQESRKTELQQQKRDIDLEVAQGAERLQSLREQGAQLKAVFKANRDERKRDSAELKQGISAEEKRLAQEDKRKPIQESPELARLKTERAQLVADEQAKRVEDSKTSSTGVQASTDNKAAQDAAKIRNDEYKKSLKAIDDLIAKQKELNKVSLAQRIAPFREKIESTAKNIFTLGKQKTAQSKVQSEAKEESGRLGRSIADDRNTATTKDGRFAQAITKAKQAVGLEQKAVKSADAVIPAQNQDEANRLQAQAEKLRSEKRRNDTIAAIREERRTKLEGTQAEINEAAALRRNAYKQAIADLKEQIREQQQLIRTAAKAGGPVDRTKLNALETEKANLQSEKRSLTRDDTRGSTQLNSLKDGAGQILNELKAFDEAGQKAATFSGKIAIVAEQIQEVRKAGLRAAIAGNEAAVAQEIELAKAVTAAKKKELSNQLVNLNDELAKEKALREKGAPNGARINELEGQRTAKRQELKAVGGPPGTPPKSSNLARLQDEGGALKSKLAGIEKSEAATRGIQKNLEEVANGAKNGISSVSQLAFAFNNVVQAAQSFALVGKGVYDAFIGSNEKLNQQLLASQTNLASSTRVFENGVEIKNPLSKQIQATREDLKSTLKQLEQDTLELVGVTSQDVNELFQITLTNASELNNQSKEFPSAIDAAAKLTKGWAAGLQTIGLPLFQARQEINSILRGTIDQNSVLAKTLDITPKMVKDWKAQGVLVDRLNERLGVYIAGNKIAAYSIDGISSNIQDLVQVVGREAGEPLIDPLVQALGQFFDYLQSRRGEIIEFFNTLTDLVGTSGAMLGNAFAPLGESLQSIGEDAGPIALKAIEGILAVVTGTLVALSPLINLLGKVIEVVAQFATTDLGGFVVQIGAAALAVKALLDISTLVAVKTFPFFIAKLIEIGSTSVNSATLISAMKAVLTDLPGTASKVGTALSSISTAAIAASKAGIGTMGASIASLGAQFIALASGGIPAMAAALQGAFIALNAVVLPVAATVAALGALAAVGYLFTENWKFDDAQEALDVFEEQVASLGDRSLDVASKMKALGKAEKEGTITPEQLASLKKYRDTSKTLTGELDQRIETLKAFKPEDEAQVERNKILIADLERQKKTLSDAAGGITLMGKELDVLGTSYEQLKQKAENADRVINSEGGGKVDVFKAGVDTKIDLINQQVAAGQLSVDEGRKQLEAIADNKKVEVDQQQKAADAITAIRKIATDQQLADIKTSQAATAAALASGQIDAVEAEKRNTEAKRAELQIQLDDIKRQIIDEKAAIAQGRGSKVKLASLTTDRGALESQLVQEQAEAEKRAQEARLKVVEDAGQKRVALASLVETNVNARIAKQLANGAISSQQAEGLKLEATEKRIAAELAAEQDKLKTLQNAAPLANKQDEADRQSKIIESQKKVADAQAAIDQNRVQQSAAAYAEVQRVAEKTANDITATEKQQEIATQELLNSGAITKEDAELRKLNATKTRIAAELALEAANRAAIDASGLNPEEKEKAKRESFNKTAQLQLDALQNQAATEEQIRAKSLEAAERIQSRALADTEAIESAKNAEIQSRLNQGLINAQDAEAQKLLATKNRIESEIAIEAAALQSKLGAGLDPEEEENLKRESAKKTADLRLNLLQTEASIEEGIRAKSLAAIDRESKAKITAIEASTIALQSQVQALAPQEQAINRINASLDRQAKILQGNAALTNAVNNLSQVQTSGNIGLLDKAQSIKSQADGEQDPEKKAKLEQLLASIGINAATTELELIRQKQAEENKAAELKMQALQAEQAQAKAQLEIQLRQQDLAIKLEQISARRALIEAQISSAKAQQALLDAQAAKGKADLIKDPAERAQAQKEAENTIANAKLGVDAAAQQTDLAKEQGQIANQAAEDQKVSAIEQRKLLAVQQDTQINQFGIDERQRKIDQSVTLIGAGGEALSSQEINASNDLITQQSKETAQAIAEELGKESKARGIIERKPSGQNAGDVVDLGIAGAESLAIAQDALVQSTVQLADRFDGLGSKKSGDGKPVPVKVDGGVTTATPPGGFGGFAQEIAAAQKRGDTQRAKELQILLEKRQAIGAEVQGQAQRVQQDQPQKQEPTPANKVDRSEIVRLQKIIDSADTSKKGREIRAAAQSKIDPLRLAARQEDQVSKRSQGLGEFQQGSKDRPLTLSQQEEVIDQARRAPKTAAKTGLEHLQNQKEMGDIAVERDRIKAQKVRENLSSTPEEIAAADKFAVDSAAIFNASILKAAKQFGINAKDAPQVDAKGGIGRNAPTKKLEGQKDNAAEAAKRDKTTEATTTAFKEVIEKKVETPSQSTQVDVPESTAMDSFINAIKGAIAAVDSFTSAALSLSSTPQTSPAKAKALPVVKLAGARLLGGDVAAGSSYLGGEGGPELVGFADGSSEMIGIDGPEIFRPRTKGYVYTAKETAAIMRINAPQSVAMPSVEIANDNSDVIRELKKLQAIVAAQPAPRSDTNNFNLSDNGGNAFGMVTEALVALQQCKRR